MVNYYDDPKNVADYIQMAEGYNGEELIQLLREVLPSGSTVLELGMGPGVDLDLLAVHYNVTGSDRAQPFLDRYRLAHPQADLLLLDAVTLDTQRRFDAIYSNKVLHHLTRTELADSFLRQADLLPPGGVIVHSFWYGDNEEEYPGMLAVYYTESTLTLALGPVYEILKMTRYAEMDEGDSLVCVCRKR
ncbi:MAG: class I SAM-dependent methyltransferase [Caldilineaceae bacterium]|nr:class I SAM-dependent methyltransferase [Caldilineaceae bacterium]MBP8110052.1 class I SAM-dependent methyltransferase [Caldilineaceae bacterium]MBP8125010.1 class I SAM-dependent methyltransferase [Caldilineaceae bacterium]MBP9074789.1 class I SAM-dependent methyltransferase [Caldilineaceae bacterium]